MVKGGRESGPSVWLEKATETGNGMGERCGMKRESWIEWSRLGCRTHV